MAVNGVAVQDASARAEAGKRGGGRLHADPLRPDDLVGEPYGFDALPSLPVGQGFGADVPVVVGREDVVGRPVVVEGVRREDVLPARDRELRVDFRLVGAAGRIDGGDPSAGVYGMVGGDAEVFDDETGAVADEKPGGMFPHGMLPRRVVQHDLRPLPAAAHDDVRAVVEFNVLFEIQLARRQFDDAAVGRGVDERLDALRAIGGRLRERGRLAGEGGGAQRRRQPSGRPENVAAGFRHGLFSRLRRTGPTVPPSRTATGWAGRRDPRPGRSCRRRARSWIAGDTPSFPRSPKAQHVRSSISRA